MSKTEIPLSQTKILIGIGGSILFIALGIYMITMINKQIWYDSSFVKIVGFASILFFGLTGIYLTKKMFDKTMGLIVDDNGIYDNSSASSVGFIKWADISAIKTEQVSSSKFLLIYTSNPEYYLNNVKGVKRKFLEGNNKMYGTPFSIASNTLKYNFNDLEKLINARFDEQIKRDPAE